MNTSPPKGLKTGDNVRAAKLGKKQKTHCITYKC